MTLTPYIMFNGTCEEALNFYANALNGSIKSLMHFEGSPAESMSADKKKVMHAIFEAKGVHLMASDGAEQPAAPGTAGVHLSLDFQAASEQENAFNALAEGGTVTMPLQDTFWGARFGMLTDKFGVNWMFNHDSVKQ